MTASANDLLLGKGKVYLDIYADGVATGEFELGNCTALALTTTAEKSDVYSSMDAEAGLLASITKRVDATLKITGNYFNADNDVLLMLGTQVQVTQAAGSAADITITGSAKLGRFFRLPHRNVSNLVIKANGTVVSPSTANYVLDATSSRVFIGVAGTIDAGDVITASYDYDTVSKTAISGGTAKRIVAYIRYVSDNTAGSNTQLQVWRADVTPDGEYGFISDDVASWSMSAKVLKSADINPTAPYYLKETI